MLEPMSPEEAVTAYLEDRKTDLASTSHQNHKYRCQRFIEWADEYGLTNMNELTGRKLHEYKKWRQEDVSAVTLKTQLGTIRIFLRFCERINVVPKGIDRKISMPTIGFHEDVNDDVLTKEEAEAILEYCTKYEYATFRHAAFYLVWHTGIRSGTVRGLDVDDYNSDQGYIEIRHRPQTGTPLKNGVESEREVTVKPEVSEVLDDFIERNHDKVEDEHGRMPLLGTPPAGCTKRRSKGTSTRSHGPATIRTSAPTIATRGSVKPQATARPASVRPAFPRMRSGGALSPLIGTQACRRRSRAIEWT